jgi:DNA-binding PadR family transcriptional regulator
MSPAQHVAAITKRIEARMAEEPNVQGDYFAVTEAGREAVRRILEEELPGEAAR